VKLGKRKAVNSDNVQELYDRWVAGESLTDIGKSIGVGPATLSKGFQNYGLKQPEHVPDVPQSKRSGKLITNMIIRSYERSK